MRSDPRTAQGTDCVDNMDIVDAQDWGWVDSPRGGR